MELEMGRECAKISGCRSIGESNLRKSDRVLIEVKDAAPGI